MIGKVTRGRLVVSVLAAVLTMGATAGGQERPMELTLDDAIDRALQENLNLRSQHLGLNSMELSVVQAQSMFDPSFNINVSRDESVTPTFYGYYNVSTIESQRTQMNVSMNKPLTTGANVGVGFYNTLSESNIETDKNFTSYFGINLTQPLLKGFGRNVNTANIYIARQNSRNTEHMIRSAASDLVYQVQQAYWDLVYAIETLKVREITLAQADSLLNYNRKGFELGILTESDVLEAESARLSRRQELLQQQNLIETYEDNLKKLLNVTDNTEWERSITPLDEPSVTSVDTSVERAFTTALKLRPDYLSAQTGIIIGEKNLEVAEENLSPSLDLEAVYRVNGSGTTYNKNLRDIGDFDQYGWNVGLVFRYPLGNRSAEAVQEQQEIALKRNRLTLRDLEDQIRKEIRAAARNVEYYRERLDDAELAIKVNELKLRKEEERFRNNLSTSYYVLQFQADLANARNQYNRTLMDYMLAVAEYERVSGTILAEHNISIITE